MIGNYYSLRNLHEKAVIYFQRALKLNPQYLSAWTLMGHEYVEVRHLMHQPQALPIRIHMLTHPSLHTSTHEHKCR